MITIKQFVGAMLEEITRARAISDGASAHIAEQYLNHELLKGFPVPRMVIRGVELELNFAVASKQMGASGLDDAEAQKNVAHRMRDLLESLPANPDYTAYFGKDAELKTKWKTGLDPLTVRMNQILAKPGTALDEVTRNLSLVVENYLFESAPDALRPGFSAFLDFSVKKGRAGASESMRVSIAKQVAAIVAFVDNGRPAPTPNDPLEMTVMIGAQELEKLNPGLLQKVKITVDSSDRKWVTIDDAGTKTAILERN